MAFTSSYTDRLIQQSEYYYGTPEMTPGLSGSFSGSFQGNGSQLTDLPGGGSTFPFSGDAEITGSLTISGSGSPLQVETDAILINVSASNEIVIGTKAPTTAGALLSLRHDFGSANDVFSIKNGQYGNGIFKIVDNRTASTSTLASIYVGGRIYDYNSPYSRQIDLGGYGLGSTYGGNASAMVLKNGGGNIGDPAGNIAISPNGSFIISNASVGTQRFIVTNYGHVSIGGSLNTDHNLTISGSSFISGSLTVSGSSVDFSNASYVDAMSISSSTSQQALSVQGSGSTVFDVIGSQGTLFSVDDDLLGTLFTANDITGLPVLEVSASGETYIGKSPQSLYTTAVISSNTANVTQSIYGLDTSSYAGAFIDYTAFSGSYDARAGTIMAIWSGSSVNYTDTATSDFGSTSNLTMKVHISQSQAQLASFSTTSGYKIKTIIRSI